MKSEDEIRQWRDIEQGKQSQLMNEHDKMVSRQIVFLLNVILEEDQ